MPRIAYRHVSLSDWKMALVHKANQLISSYRQKGYNLTLRQLYYQFVSRDWLPERWADEKTGSTNNQRSYKNLGDLLNDARMGGHVDWEGIEDRTRSLSSLSHWESPQDGINAIATQYRLDKWDDQPKRVEVWVEKDAMEDVVGRAAQALDCAYFSCRGYTSMSSIWEAAQRFRRFVKNGQEVVVLHLGDHDPSGIDMSRDIEDRLRTFMGRDQAALSVERIALNMDQVKRYQPPPNPAKVTDSRYTKYSDTHGEESWELDALEPEVVNRLITSRIEAHLIRALYDAREAEQEADRSDMIAAATSWDDVVAFVRDGN